MRFLDKKVDFEALLDWREGILVHLRLGVACRGAKGQQKGGQDHEGRGTASRGLTLGIG